MNDLFLSTFDEVFLIFRLAQLSPLIRGDDENFVVKCLTLKSPFEYEPQFHISSRNIKHK